MTRILCFCLLLATGCGGGQYGFSRYYEPQGDEDDYFEQASPANYEEVRRDPAGYRSQLLGWFGVVKRVTPSQDGTSQVAMTYRVHRDRHLCRDERSSSCRVTVSDRESGPFTGVVRLQSEDTEGANRVWLGSLLKVYGHPTGEFDSEGGPIITVEYYRHWPRGYYTTTGASATLRQ